MSGNRHLGNSYLGCVLVPLGVCVAESAQTSTTSPVTMMAEPLIKTSDQTELTYKSAASEGLFAAKASYVFLGAGDT